MSERPILQRILLFIVAAALAVSLVSCGNTDETKEPGTDGGDTVTVRDLRIAFVFDPADGFYGEGNEEISRGLSSFASEHGFEFSKFSAVTEDADGRLKAMESAAAIGPDVIVCAGIYMQETVIEVQKKYPGIGFLIVGGEEPSEEISQGFLENTHGIVFKEEDAGYVAGYIAVTEGFTSPAFFAFTPFEATSRCFGGFVKGASDAADEAGKDGVTVFCSVNNCVIFAGLDGAEEISEGAVSAEELFDKGADVIAATGVCVADACDAASACGGKVIPVCFPISGNRPEVIVSPRYEYGRAAVNAVERFVANGVKWSVRDAGTCSRAGLAEDAVTVNVPSGASSSSFDMSALERLKGKVKDGSIRIPRYESVTDADPGSVRINYIGMPDLSPEELE